MMNMIFKGDMEPMLADPAKIDWTAIETKVKPYGAPADEILLRAKTIHFYNNQDWVKYVPAASAYLGKYGKITSLSRSEGCFRAQLISTKEYQRIQLMSKVVAAPQKINWCYRY